MNRAIIFISFILLLGIIQACEPKIAVNDLPRGMGAVKIPIAGEQPLELYSASYALLIGEISYVSWPDLESIPRELQEVQAVLQAQGFQVTQKSNLDGIQLEQAFKDFINDHGFDPNNRLLFFFSGHGYTRKNGDKGYIVPVDAPNPQTQEREFLQKAIEMESIMGWARRIEAKHALFLFDSCFSGTVFKAKNLPQIPRYIDKMVARPVRQFITAGSADETVPAKSVFTPAFVDGLREGRADVNRDGFVTGDELGVYLAGEVPKYTQQTPQFGKIKEYELAQGNFVFALGENPVEVAQPPVVPPPTGPSESPSHFTNSIGMEFVLIPAGHFMMGASPNEPNADSNEFPRHEVTIAEPFYMGKYEVTQAQWEQVMGNNPSRFKGAHNPVETISWNDAQAFIKRLNALEKTRKYRLPTEAEWEYAARGGTTTAYWWGNDIGRNNANCDGYGSQWDDQQTAPVGSFKPNPFGLYDTAGNVWEWCEDTYHENYNGAPTDGSAWVMGGKQDWHVLRGGSWYFSTLLCRAASRSWNYDQNDRNGFRVVVLR